MNTDKDEILRKIALLMTDFEEGDVLLISDIIDEVTRLKEVFNSDKGMLGVVDKLIGLLDGAMSGNAEPGLVSTVSGLLDTIQRGTPSKLNTEIKTSPGERQDDQEQDQSGSNMIDVLKVFIVEAVEKISRSEELILELENDYDNKEIINELFRCFHTIKGGVRIFKTGFIWGACP